MAGLESYDSSIAPDQTGGGQPTLGSLASSFRPEDYTDGGFGTAGLGGNAAAQDWGSLMDETESSTGHHDDDDGGEDEADYRHQQRHQQPTHKSTSRVLPSTLSSNPPRPSSSSSAAHRSTEAPSTSSRPNSRFQSTKATTASFADDDGESEVDEVALRELELSNERAKGGSKGEGKEKSGGSNLTLREQEKVIDDFKKENFDLKLKIHFYEERLARLAPDQIDAALRENVHLKVSFQSLKLELKRYKKLLLEGQKAIEALRKGEGEREREVTGLREKVKRGGGRRTETFDGEDARAEISRLRAELDAERDAREDALAEADQLRAELRDRNDGNVTMEGGKRARDKEMRREFESLSKRCEELEQINTSQRSQITAQVTMLSARNDEKDALRDEVETLKQDLVNVENELEHHERSRARNERHGSSSGEEKTREDLERENDDYRDRASAHALDLERLEAQLEEKEKEIEDLLEDLDRHKEDHEAELKQLEDDWRDEVENARGGIGELKDMLEEKDAETDELSQKIEALLVELAEKDKTMKADSEEVEALTSDLKQLGQQIYKLEEEIAMKDQKLDELEVEFSAIDRELETKTVMHDQVVDALKEKLAATKAQFTDRSIQHESSLTELAFLREKVEELALSTADATERAKTEGERRKRVEDECSELMRALRKEEEERDLDQREWGRQRREEEDKWEDAVEGKTREIRRLTSDLATSKSHVTAKEADVQRLQDLLNTLQRESGQRSGQAASVIELERLKRDVARYEGELDRERDESEKAREALGECEAKLAAALSDARELTNQLASQTQSRLTLTEKYDVAARSLRDMQSELANAKDRVRLAEDQFSNDQRAISRTENQYRDQLTERNTLLLTVFQYMDKMVGAAGDRSPRKSGVIDPKPFNNFPVFHDSLINRLKGVNQIQTSFERRTKDIEAKFTDQFAQLKRQHEARLKQLDRVEGSVKAATDTQRQWRQRVNAKQLEVDEKKAAVARLESEILLLRQQSSASSNADPGLSAKLSVLTTRATGAERKLAATQAQLLSAEEKLGEARTKVGVAEGQWQAKVRELEARLRASDEKVKRERQGAKERVQELQVHIQDLEVQVGGAKRRDQLLDDVMSAADRAAKGSPNPVVGSSPELPAPPPPVPAPTSSILSGLFRTKPASTVAKS